MNVKAKALSVLRRGRPKVLAGGIIRYVRTIDCRSKSSEEIDALVHKWMRVFRSRVPTPGQEDELCFEGLTREDHERLRITSLDLYGR